jgi:hypothetical protein
VTEALLNHPSDEALGALSLGRLAEAELAQVSAHLTACPACCSRIDQLATDDRLLACVQKGAASREQALVGPGQRRAAVRALGQLHVARSVTRVQDPQVGTVPEIANASAAQTHRDAPPSRGLSDNLTSFLAPPEQPDEVGRLGPYRILAVLAHGGMGVVFRARDPALDRLVALKAMLPGVAVVPSARERFLREARAAAALKHPHVVTIFQVGEDRGIPFLAMEFLEGEPLDDRLRREGRLPLAEVLRIGREIALALAAAHARGLVHRDIKPANLWLEGPTGHVKVLDFGLAWAQANQAHLTQSGLIVGTPAYMAPEQAEGKPADPRCDLFSLGCVLYQMNTGALPFHGESTIAVLRALALHEPPPVAELCPESPPELSALVTRLLAKKPEDRPATAQEVAETLHTLEQLPAMPAVPQPMATPARRSRKPLVAVAGAALAGAALAVALALLVVLWPTPHGTVRIESDDPAVEVVFGKAGPTIKGADKEPITLRAGEHGVLIKRGDFTFEADRLVLKKGAALTLKVELLRGKVQVMQDGQVVASQDMRLPPPPPAKAPGTKRAYPLTGWLQKVAALPAEEQVKAVAGKLKYLNPGFDGKITHWSHKDGIITELHFCVDLVTDISPVQALPGLTVLNLAGSAWGKGQLADLSPLKGMTLTRLSIWATRVTDLSVLSGMKLTYLGCAGSPVTDLAPLRGMPLMHLDCQYNGKLIKSLAPLEGMPLKKLNFSLTDISDLSPLRGMKLEEVSFDFCPVADLSPLKGMPLQRIEFHTTLVSNLSPLEGLPLTRMTFRSTRVQDLSPLKHARLTSLDCTETLVTDLSPLRGMPLKELKCSFNAERDAGILRSIKTLEMINDKPAAAFWKELDAKPGAQQR